MSSQSDGMQQPEEGEWFEPQAPLRLKLSSAELAVIFQHLFPRLEADAAGMAADLNLGAEDLGAARASLLQKGLLLNPPRRAETVLAPELQPVLSAVTQPGVLFVLQIARPGQAEKRVYFSWTPGQLACNTLDEQGSHLIEALDSLEALAAVALRESGLDPFQPSPSGEPLDPEALYGSASLRAIWMAAENPGAAGGPVEVFSWLVSQGQLWLLSGQPTAADRIRVQPASLAELRQAILESAGGAIVRRARQAAPAA